MVARPLVQLEVILASIFFGWDAEGGDGGAERRA
jgi:hypothetical protein